MLRKFDKNQNKLMEMLEEKSRKTLLRFRQESVKGFNYPKLVSMVEDVNAYWRDVQRPALTFLSCEAVGGDPLRAVDASLMITLAAAGMGIHDDIIDKSENKHFRETILGRYGLDNALLVGDLLIIKGLSYSMRFLSQEPSIEKREAVLEALQNFIFEIYEGELMDILCRKNLDTDLDDYCNIMWKLTSDGEACARIGAILGGGSEKEIEAIAQFGKRLGFVIHLAEELKDSFNIEGGLPHRLEYESIPLPILYAAKSSKKTYAEIKSIIQNSPTADLVTNLMELCWKTKSVSYVYNLSRKNAGEAFKQLNSIKPSPARSALALMMRVPISQIQYERGIENRFLRLCP